MPNSPEDIIELTDIIEHGPDGAKPDDAGGGVDLSFERELEDLFADNPQESPAKSARDLPGMDSLELPDDSLKAGDEGDIDLDGLDALLADAEKSQPDSPDAMELELPGEIGGSGADGLPDLGDMPDLGELPDLGDMSDLGDVPDLGDLPGLDDDISAKPAHEPSVLEGHPEEDFGSSGEVFESASPALEALEARLDLLEERFSGMGDAVTASFKMTLEEALENFKAGFAAPAGADPAPLIAELRESIEARLDALQAGLPVPLDEEALVARIKGEVLAALPEPASSGLDADAAQALLDERLEAFRAELPAPLDEEALAARIKDDVLAGLPEPALPEPVEPAAPGMSADEVESLLDERLAAIKAEMPVPLDEEALAARIKDEVLAGLPEPVEGPDAAALVDGLSTRLEGELDEVKARIASIPRPVDPAPLVSELAAGLTGRLDALEAQAAGQTAPDLSRMATRDELAALRKDILDEIGKAVPAAAARIIREEIQALVQEMD